ncbi:MAG: phospholipase [Clostridia bacterium]|nr:phospholipase [Clostridia bacterium]
MYEKCYYSATVGQSFHYLKYMPNGMKDGEKYPLLIFMHGAGERGNTDGSQLDLVASHGYFKYIKEGKEYPMIMVAPQCPCNEFWGSYIESLNRFLDYIIDSNPIDTDRIYLTGLSMGGTATWLWAQDGAKNRFAAISPICGEGISWYGARLAAIPVRAFHGDLDEAVSPHESLAMVSRINAYSGTANASLTIFAGVGHNAWDYAYNDELIEWFLAHRNSDKKDISLPTWA